MKKSFLSFTTIVLFLISACSNPTNEQHDNHEGHDHASTEEKTETSIETIQINEGQLNAIYKQYLTLTEALVDSDLGKAKIAANVIEAGATSLKEGGLIKSSASEITAAATINSARESYSVLSDELISMIKKAGLKSGEIYVAYCPMVQNDKGAYWLSNEKGIENPYYGASMLTCGEMKESIL